MLFDLPRSGDRTAPIARMAGFLARSSPPRSDGEGVPPCARDPEDEGAVYCPRRRFNRTRAADFDDLTGRVSRPFRWLTRKVTTVSVSWLAANRKFAVGSSAKNRGSRSMTNEPWGVGASLLRREDERHLHGRGEFVSDIKLPGTNGGRLPAEPPRACPD